MDTSTKYGSTPLHEAVDGGSYAIVQLLCKAGADVNGQRKRFLRNYAADGSTALYIEAFKQWLDCIRHFKKRKNI